MAIAAEIFIGSVGNLGNGRASEGDLGELDSCSAEILVAGFSTWRTGAASQGYARGGAFPGFSGMYVRDLSAVQEASGAIVTAVGHGILSGTEKRRREIYCAGRQVAVGPISKKVLVWSTEEEAEDAETGDSTEGKRQIDKLDDDGEVEYVSIATPSGTAERWNINEAIVTITDTYFTTSQPSMAVVGAAFSPPSPPTPPSYAWAGYSEPMRANHPNGWVLDDRSVDVIVPGSLYRVRDTAAYYYADQPD